jgi:hypothetical protein
MFINSMWSEKDTCKNVMTKKKKFINKVLVVISNGIYP